MKAVEAMNVSKKFGSIIALDGVTVSFNNGVYGLIGPNGSGKTTFIRIMLGLQKPSSGKILVFDKDPFYSHGQVCSLIGYLREKCAFPKWVTGIEYLKHVSRLKRVEFDQNVLTHPIVKGGFLTRKISTYSAGMIQRLGLIQALIGNPSLIVLDEPSTNLDPLGRIELIELIRKIKNGNKTIVVSTHILEDLEQICDFIIVMKRGRIIAKDNLEKFVTSFSSDGTLANAYARVMENA